MALKIPKPGMFVKDREIFDTDFGPLKIDKDKVKKFKWAHRGSVRLSSGKYYTADEFEKRRMAIRKESLP
ncbi:MAG: hypothetical protein GWP12_00745 [Nitrospirae bacterium]|nr:hypothetical protein [Nitrospirota bacterium]